MHTGMYARWRLKAWFLWAVAACVAIQGQSPSKQQPDPALAALGRDFVSDTAQGNPRERTIQSSAKERDRGAAGAGCQGKLAFRGTHTELRRGFAGAWVANIKIGVIKNSVHYVVDERPEAVAELIERYASLSDDCQSIMRRHTENLPIHKKVVSVGAINGARRS